MPTCIQRCPTGRCDHNNYAHGWSCDENPPSRKHSLAAHLAQTELNMQKIDTLSFSASLGVQAAANPGGVSVLLNESPGAVTAQHSTTQVTQPGQHNTTRACRH